MDQGPPHKTRHTKINRKEIGEDSWGHWLSRKLPEQNTNSLCSKFKNRPMGSHKITKFL